MARTVKNTASVHRVKVTYNKRPDQVNSIIRYFGPYDALPTARGQSTRLGKGYHVESAVVESLTGEWVADAAKADA